jgi:ribonuclease P protein component
MLPVKYRLKNKETFNTVFQKGETVSGEVLIMKVRSGSDGEVKIGFSAGLKFSKKSSRRNKIKRWMREAARPFANKIKPGFHIVFLVNSKCDFRRLTLGLIREKTENLLIKAKLLI